MENITKTAIVGVVALLIGVILGSGSLPGVRFGGMMGGGNIDQHFIDQMIPHHEGAIAMANLALEKSKRADILSLSKGIIEAQTREINNMKAWYADWFGGAPKNVGHGMHMEGMEGDIEKLKNALDFDKEFLSQMIVHHEMAVMMARMLDSGTKRSEMKVLADQIITSQTQEITMMRSWLSQ